MDLHGEISELMMKKGWLNPYDMKEQIPIDLKAAETAVQIAQMKLVSQWIQKTRDICNTK